MLKPDHDDFETQITCEEYYAEESHDDPKEIKIWTKTLEATTSQST